MAESIIIHFNEIEPGSVLSRLESRLGACSCHLWNLWNFPPEDPLVIVQPYRDFDAEYETSERNDLISKLGGIPTVSFDFQIRRGRSDEACDVLERFIRNELNGLAFVVDDMWRLISWRELDGDIGFLDCYRSGKQAEQGVPPNGP